MKLVCSIISILALTTGLFAQPSFGGFPKGLGKKNIPALTENFKLPLIDENALLAEDEQMAAAGEKSLRFGQDVHVDISPSTHGQWNTLADGSKLWRLLIKSTGAKSLNLIFDEFNLKTGEELFVYAPDGSMIQGSFTDANNNRIFNFATMPLAGAEAIIEFFQPAGYPLPQLHLSYIIHGYRDFSKSMKGFGDSGNCNNNVICPEGADWVDQRNSVVMLLTSNNSRFCSGAAVNNTANDGTPYVLSADHCDVGATDLFLFNYWSPNCTPNSDGNTSDIVVGCIPRANNSNSDFALVELADEIPAEYNAYLSGWSRQNTAPPSSVSIHHPRGDVMKITFDEDPAGIEDYSNADCWHILDWEDGTTEPGSSGSPLFNENHLIIGQLYGGTANCNNNIDDYYGRFVTSWSGNAANRRLRDWLDPNGLDLQTMEGRPASLPTLALDARISAILSPLTSYCNTDVIVPEITVRNGGIQTITSLTIEYSFGTSGTLTYNWTGSLGSLQNANIALPSYNLTVGDNQQFTATIVNANGGQDNDPSNNQRSVSVDVAEGSAYGLTIVSDNYPEETSWELRRTSSNEIIESLSQGDLPQGTTSYTWCLAPGCYTFIIRDQYGDGICCGFFSGNGSYSVSDENGTVLGSGGEFTNSDEVEFCIDTVTGFIPISENEMFAVFPNPSAGQFGIYPLGKVDAQGALAEVMDITGKLVASTTLSSSISFVNTSDWGPGIYLLRITSGNRQFLKKLIINQ